MTAVCEPYKIEYFDIFNYPGRFNPLHATDYYY